MPAYNAIAHETGGPEVLGYEPMDHPHVAEGQLLVEVAATGVNFIETYRRAGQYAVDFPFVPGSECAGTVIAVGENVSGFQIGDRIATMWGKKTYATHTLVDAAKAVRIPDQIEFVTAAAMLSQGITAHYLSVDCFPVRKEHTILVHAGAGGVGRLLIQMGKLAGATVIATTSTGNKAKIATEAGADHVLRYDLFADQVRELTEGIGVDAVFDGVGKDTFDGSLKSLRKRGTMVLFGGSSGPVPPFELQRLNTHGSLFITRPKTGDYLSTDQERQRRIKDVVELVAAGRLKIHVGKTFPLAQAAQAHAALENRETTGKTVLIP